LALPGVWPEEGYNLVLNGIRAEPLKSKRLSPYFKALKALKYIIFRPMPALNRTGSALYTISVRNLTGWMFWSTMRGWLPGKEETCA
jgi:hypothetical protein